MVTSTESLADSTGDAGVSMEVNFTITNCNTTMNFTQATEISSTDQNITFLQEISSEMNISENSILLDKIQPKVYDIDSTTSDGMISDPITGAGPDLNLTTSESILSQPKFSDMEIWFIATGSVVLAVIVLFCINTCIQCGVFEKLFKCFERRNQMAQIERRSRKDLEFKHGHPDDHKTTTHMFIHRIFSKKNKQPAPT